MRPEHRHVVSLRIAEINPSRERIFPQHLLHRSIDDLEYERVVLELHLGLSRADVHVHAVRIHFQIDEIGWSDSVSDHPLVGLHNGLVQVRTPEIPSVDEEKLVSQSFPRRVRPSNETPQAYHGGVRADINNISGDRCPEKIHNPVFQGFRRLENENVLPVVTEREPNLRPRQSHFRELFDNMLELYVVRLQEFPSGRHIVEKISDSYVCPFRSGDLCRGIVDRRRELNLAANLLILRAGLQRHLSHRRDRGQRLAPESEGRDVLQILRGRDFRCGVPLETEHGIVRIHPLAVVYDLDQSPSRVLDYHRDLFRPRIYGILHKFLHHGSRPLHNLSRGDHIRYVSRQYPEFHPKAVNRIS